MGYTNCILANHIILRKSPMSYHLETMDIGSVWHMPLKLLSCALLRRYHSHLILLGEEYSSSRSLKNHLHPLW